MAASEIKKKQRKRRRKKKRGGRGYIYLYSGVEKKFYLAPADVCYGSREGMAMHQDQAPPPPGYSSVACEGLSL